MPHYHYLIVGGGMAAAAAINGIRERDTEHTIGLISEEADGPYKRPPLSKGLWTGDKSYESIWYDTQQSNVELHLGRKVNRLDLENKVVTDDQGNQYGFDKLLLATGGTPNRLPFGGDRIIYFRTADDYRRLRALAETGQRFAVLGGGFIGSEVAAALAMSGKEVILLFPEKAIGERVYPADLARFLNDYYRQKGIDVQSETMVVDIQPEGDQLAVITNSGQRMVVDGVVAGIGIKPNTALAQEAGLKVANGILVDESLQTSHPDVYAAGDVALYYDPSLQKQRRVEHEDNAKTMGRAAGRAMAGERQQYSHLPYFYSDLFDLGYEAVGDLDARLEMVTDWKEPYRKGVIYYLDNKRVRGVLLWNVWHQVDAARNLVAEPGPFEPDTLKGRLPEPK